LHQRASYLNQTQILLPFATAVLYGIQQARITVRKDGQLLSIAVIVLGLIPSYGFDLARVGH